MKNIPQYRKRKFKFIFDDEDAFMQDIVSNDDSESFIIDGAPEYLPTTLYPIDETVCYPMTFTNNGNYTANPTLNPNLYPTNYRTNQFSLFDSNYNLTAPRNGLPYHTYTPDPPPPPSTEWVVDVSVEYGRVGYSYASLLAQLENKPVRINKIRLYSANTAQLEQALTIIKSDASGEYSSMPESTIFSIFQNQPTILDVFCNIILDGNVGMQIAILPKTSIEFRLYPSIEQPLFEKVNGVWKMFEIGK